jgi:hypothetical protein
MKEHKPSLMISEAAMNAINKQLLYTFGITTVCILAGAILALLSSGFLQIVGGTIIVTSGCAGKLIFDKYVVEYNFYVAENNAAFEQLKDSGLIRPKTKIPKNTI